MTKASLPAVPRRTPEAACVGSRPCLLNAKLLPVKGMLGHAEHQERRDLHGHGRESRACGTRLVAGRHAAEALIRSVQGLVPAADAVAVRLLFGGPHEFMRSQSGCVCDCGDRRESRRLEPAFQARNVRYVQATAEREFLLGQPRTPPQSRQRLAKRSIELARVDDHDPRLSRSLALGLQRL
jgi:hypothetical protein